MFNQETPAVLREMLEQNREGVSSLDPAAVGSIPEETVASIPEEGEGESPGPEMFQQLLNQQG